MTPWEALYPDVMPWIGPGRAEPMVDHQLLRSAQAFCRATRAWCVDLDPVRTTGSELSYDIEFPGAADLVRLESATLDGDELEVWRAGGAKNSLYVFTPERKTVELSRPVGANRTLVLRVSVMPSNKAYGIEDEIFASYAEVIARGAVARINRDAVMGQWFDDECERIKIKTWRSNSSARPRAVGVAF